MKEFPSKHYWCGKCELTTPIYGNEYVRCKICGSTDVVLKEKITDKLNFDADELFIKEFLNRLIKCVKPIALLDKSKIDAILAEMKEDRSGRKQKYPEGIISFSDGKKEFLFSGVLFSYTEWVWMNFEAGNKIHSVKNRHGEVLTVGQESNYGKIMCFKIMDNHIFVGADKLPGSNTKGMPGIGRHMDGVHPLSKGIVTEDGYTIKEHDGVWLLDLNDYGFSFYENALSVAKREGSLLFKRRANCEKYIDENKPMFSKQQIVDALKKHEIPNTNSFIYCSVLKKNLGI